MPGHEIAWLETSSTWVSSSFAIAMCFLWSWPQLRLPFVDAQLLEELTPIPAAQRLASGKQLLQQAVPEILERLPLEAKRGFSFPFQSWFEQPDSPMRPGSALPMPGTPTGLDLAPWARRWSLIVLRQWLHSHMGIELPRV